MVTPFSIQGALGTMSPYKAPGMDGIYPVLLKQGCELLTPHLVELYHSCLAFGYILKSWRAVRVVFMPKPGKTSYTTAKSFRPLNLSSFLLKGLEKVTYHRLSARYLQEHPLSKHQHAYQSGKSTETALHSFVSTVHGALEDKNYALACFLDIQGAFDNVRFDDIKRALIRRGVASVIVNWAMNMLQQHVVHASLGTYSCWASTTQGSAQGGVLSALFWVLAVDDLVNRLNGLRYFTVCYSDDVTICLRSFCLSTLCDMMHQALHIVEAWCKRSGLTVNADKTELMVFT